MDILVIFTATKLHLIAVVLALVFFFFAGYKQKNRIIRLSLLTLPMSFIIGRILSAFIENPRPFLEHNVEPLIQHVADNGFPSEHTLLVVTIGSVIYVYNKKVGGFLIALGLLVGAGRVIAKVHHTVDVLGSFVIATLATYVSYRILERINN